MSSGGLWSWPSRPCEWPPKRLRGRPVSRTVTLRRARPSCRAPARPAKLPPMMMTSSMVMGSVLWMEGAGLGLARNIVRRYALEPGSEHGRGHDPDGGVHPHLAIGAHLAPKVGGDDVLNLGAQVRVLAQHGGERAHPLGDDHTVFEAPAADLGVVRGDGDLAEAGFGEDAAHPLWIGEGERTGRQGIGRREGRQKVLRGLERRGHVRVFRGWSP